MRARAALVLAAALGGVAAQQECKSDRKLELQEVNVTLLAESPLYRAGAACADGSALGYYYDSLADAGEDDAEADFIVWLGDNQLCSGDKCDELCAGVQQYRKDEGSVCSDLDDDDFFGGVSSEEEISERQAQCLFSRVACTSEWWSSQPKVRPETLLCHNDPLFGKFKRAYLPSCTLDWWLGTGTNNVYEVAEGVSSEMRHRGRLALRELVMDLAFTKNLTFARRVVFGGTRGAAVGLLNSMGFLEQLLEDVHSEIVGPDGDPVDRTVMAVLDSAWAFNTEQFAPSSENPLDIYTVESNLLSDTADWLDGAALDAACLKRWNFTSDGIDMRYRCLIASEVAKLRADDRLLFVQSQFDLVQLEALGLLDTNATEQFQDTASYASSAISYIETFGQNVRSDLEDSAAVRGAADTHFYFTTPCAQHGYVVPTSFHELQPRVEAIGDFGSLQFQRNFEVWATVAVNGLTVKGAVTQFVSTNGTSALVGPDDAALGVSVRNNIRADTCGTFLCNSACPTQVLPYTVPSQLGMCPEYMVVGYGASLLLFFYVAFMLSVVQVMRFRRTVRRYWDRIKLIEASTADKADQTREVQQQLLNESSSSEYRKIHLMVENASYWAPPRKRRGKPHQILRNVDLAFAPGKVHAIMGPSGSGKSTLLDVLALTRDTGSVSGTHYINGLASHSAEAKFLREWLRHNSSHVRQADVLFPRLTVREHLVHSAWLMLPQYMPAEAKLRRVWQVLRLLELDGCADTICGDGGVTIEGGISGGQRRRVSVATQLLKMPAVLLLDEPTSGLDSTNALLLVKALHTFAHEGGVNVLMTIHQPRKEIFGYLDSLSFLVQGRVVFSGAAEAAGMHFRLPASSTNIANDILDELQTCTEQRLREYEESYLNGPLGGAVQEEMEAEITETDPDMIRNIKGVLVENSLAEGRWSWSESSSASMLSWVLISRAFRRGAFDVRITGFLAALGGAVVGLIFLDLNSYTTRTALVYLIVATMTFLQGTFNGDRYLGEKRMYDHETASGTFRSWVAFLISQFLRDAATSSIEGVLFAAPVYWIGGLNQEPERFGLYMLLMLLTALAVLCQNVFIEIDRNNYRAANMLQIGLLGLGALFNGFIVKLDDIPVYFSWVPYLMVSYWSFVGTLINDLSKFTFPCDVSVLECAARTGDVIISSLSYNNRDVFVCILALLVFVVVFRILAVIDFYVRYVLKRGRKLRRVAEESMTGVSAGARSPRTPRTPRTPRVPGSKNTMDAMLGAQTPTMKRQDSGGSGGSSAVSSFNLATGDGFGSPVSSKGMPHSPRGQGKGSTASPLPKSEMSFYDEEEVELNFVQSPLVTFVLDRNVFLLWFLLDFYSSAYLCGFAGLEEDDPSPLPLVVFGIALSAIYAVFFFLHVFLLIPTTLDGKLDCTWAGGYDAAAGLSLAVDLALTIQANSTPQFEVQLVLAGIVRFMRFLRVYIYWNKVDAFHRVRARSFLHVKDELVEEMAAVNINSPGRRISGFEQPSRPGRGGAQPPPPRPQRPGGATGPGLSAYRMQTTSLKRLSLKRRSNNNQLALTPLMDGSPGSGGPARPPRPQRPQRPPRPAMLSQRFRRLSLGGRGANAAQSPPRELGPMWRAMGNGYVYNPYTGQTMSATAARQRGPPPPPPPQ